MSTAPSGASPGLAFEAVTTPHRSRPSVGLWVVAGLAGVASLGLTGLFWSLGAWPVAGFMGVEVVLVLGLLAAHGRWSARMTERIALREGKLTVERTDWRGRRRAASFEAYWTRIALNPRPGQVSELRLSARRRSVEIGAFLTEEDKRDLASALERALHAHRNPVFDNPQTRGA